jgi:formylglycine-generating enzyme
MNFKLVGFILLFAGMGLLLGQTANHFPTVENVRFVQRTDGSLIVDMYYDARDVDGDTLLVSVQASSDNGVTWTYACTSLSGDIGKIVPGTNKRIVWNFNMDHTRITGSGFRVKVNVDDRKGANLDWIQVASSTFRMGDTWSGGDADESPVRSVTLNGFYISKCEITSKQYATFLNAYGSDKVKSGEFAGQTMIYVNARSIQKVGTLWQAAAGFDNFPVINVTWYGAYEFCRYYGYRLPTEAEWEFACRTTKDDKWAGTSTETQVNDYAWHSGNSTFVTHAVATRKENGIGLNDMSGNVWEWCQDWYGAYSGTLTNPTGPETGTNRVIRGGSWYDAVKDIRSANRSNIAPAQKNDNIGFRAARSL